MPLGCLCVCSYFVAVCKYAKYGIQNHYKHSEKPTLNNLSLDSTQTYGASQTRATSESLERLIRIQNYTFSVKVVTQINSNTETI